MKDTIYRDDAIKCCRNEWEEEVEERLRLLPSAEPEILACGNGELDTQTERKSGEWVACQDGKYHCSRCDDVAPKGCRWNYCPNCGARMGERKEE